MNSKFNLLLITIVLDIIGVSPYKILDVETTFTVKKEYQTDKDENSPVKLVSLWMYQYIDNYQDNFTLNSSSLIMDNGRYTQVDGVL